MDAVNTVVADPSNAEQARIWDGVEGDFWTDNADQFDRSVAAYDETLLGAAALRPTDRALDIGCGTGQTTRAVSRAVPSGSALGVDLSAKMIALARRRAADDGIVNVRFEQVDAQIHPFDDESFDLAISRTGTMFFGDPTAAFGNIARATRPSGRLVLLTWRDMAHNEWIRSFFGALAAGRDLPMPPPDAVGPFALSDPARVRRILDDSGYADVDLTAVEAPMDFGSDVDAALHLVLGVVGWLLEGLDDASREGAIDSLRRSLTDHKTATGVLYGSAAWVITARRVLRVRPAAP